MNSFITPSGFLDFSSKYPKLNEHVINNLKSLQALCLVSLRESGYFMDGFTIPFIPWLRSDDIPFHWLIVKANWLFNILDCSHFDLSSSIYELNSLQLVSRKSKERYCGLRLLSNDVVVSQSLLPIYSVSKEVTIFFNTRYEGKFIEIY